MNTIIAYRSLNLHNNNFQFKTFYFNIKDHKHKLLGEMLLCISKDSIAKAKYIIVSYTCIQTISKSQLWQYFVCKNLITGIFKLPI